MCGLYPDEAWMCDRCLELYSENPKARLCPKCYEYGKSRSGFLVRASWAWGEDLEPHADEIIKDFLQHIERMKPLE